MANVLNEEKKQQILALGRLGWSLRRIQQATRVRRETISGYLKAAGITVWRSGGWSRQGQPKPAMQVITDPVNPAIRGKVALATTPVLRTRAVQYCPLLKRDPNLVVVPSFGFDSIVMRHSRCQRSVRTNFWKRITSKLANRE